MKLNEMMDCRHIKDSEAKIGINREVEELQKIISDRWDEIWNIVQARNSRDAASNSRFS